MTKGKYPRYEQGRELPAEEKNTETAAATPASQQPTATQVVQPSQPTSAMTYELGKDGKINAGADTGLPVGTTLATSESNIAGLTRPTFEEWYATVPADRNDTTNYNLRRAYELAPYEELERWRTATPEQLQNDDSYHLKSMYFDPETGVGEFMKSKNHPTVKGELDFYNADSPESKAFRDKYELDATGDYYRYVPRAQVKQVNVPVGDTTVDAVVEDGQQNTGKPKEAAVQQENTERPAYRYNWDQALKDGKTYRQAIRDKNYRTNPDEDSNYVESYLDYNRWAEANGKPKLDILEWNAAMHPDDEIGMSPEENEKARKRKQWEEAFEHAGNVMMTLGNFVGAAMGAPAPDNMVDPKQLTERQRKLREVSQAQRSAYRKSLFEQMWKQKAEDYNQKKMDLEARKQDRLEEQTRISSAKADAYIELQRAQTEKNDAMTAYYQAKIEALNQGLPLDLAEKRARIALANARRGQANASAGLSSARAAKERSAAKSNTKGSGGKHLGINIPTKK